MIVGVDCATVPGKRGVAVARFDPGACTVRRVETGLTDSEIAELVAECLRECDSVLLALDAPLGWPEPLGAALADHQAGQPLVLSADELFRRDTDRFIKEILGKQPLDVGADRIARTAHSALRLLARISETIGVVIPLAWEAGFSAVAAIEVYPAATLRSYGLRDSGYKDKASRVQRKEIIIGLPPRMALHETCPLLDNADALDSVLCTLAAADFLSGEAYPPTDLPLARKEGWIWVRRTEA